MFDPDQELYNAAAEVERRNAAILTAAISLTQHKRLLEELKSFGLYNSTQVVTARDLRQRIHNDELLLAELVPALEADNYYQRIVENEQRHRQDILNRR